jgi:hypothetical protein
MTDGNSTDQEPAWGNVTSLRGGSVPRSLEVHAPLVADLERLLEEARAGKVVAVAAAVQFYNDEAGMLVRGRTKPFLLAGALDGVKSLVLEPLLKTVR